jgi:anti-sigma regulatory factor (Ser/Thr protein kinase)
MTERIQERGSHVRRYILENVEKNPGGITTQTAKHFSISRQAAHRHLRNLVKEKALTTVGTTRNIAYKICSQFEWQTSCKIVPGLAEHEVWEKHIEPIVAQFPSNVVAIWHYAFTEMFNNAIDHSGGTEIWFHITRTAVNTQLWIMDNGIGIFRKIQGALNLADERHAILELSKGKLTTSPENHTGQGIFFTSRLVDLFDIYSGGVCYSHELGDAEEDWIFERKQPTDGTSIFLKLNNHTDKTCKKVFDKYSDKEDLGFVKTIVPVRLAQYGNDRLISRSQAKRLLARVELFKIVVLNFEGVPTIGQAFADEIFRVFANAHSEIELVHIHANSEVKRMIESAKQEKNPLTIPDLSLV